MCYGWVHVWGMGTRVCLGLGFSIDRNIALYQVWLLTHSWSCAEAGVLAGDRCFGAAGTPPCKALLALGWGLL